MKIGQKLILGFVGIALLVGVIAIISVLQNKKLHYIAEEEVYTSISHLDDVWKLMEAQEHQEIAANSYLFLGADLKARRADYFREKERLEKIYQKYRKEACEHAKPWIEKHYENIKMFNAKIEEAFELHRQGADPELIKERIKEANKYAEAAHEKALEPIIEHVHKEHVKPAREDISKGISRTANILIISGVIAVFLAMSLGLFISRSISVPIMRLKDAAVKIGAGNFDTNIEIKSNDEIGQLGASFKEMAEDLKTTTTSIDNLNQEITERKKAEEQILKTQAQLKSVLKTIPSGLFTVDLDKTVTSWNRMAESISGLKMEDVIGKKCTEIWDCPTCLEKCGLYANDVEKPIFGKECLITLPDGKQFLASKNVTYLLGEKGEIIGGAESFMDITGRKKAEQALQESEEKYKTLTEGSLTGVFIQQDGRYVFVNKRFAQIHGYRPEELLGRQYQSLIHPDERKTVAQIVSKRLAGEPVTQRYEMRRLKKNGQTIWCEVMVTRVDYKGKPALMGNIIDTTVRKKAEELLEKLNEDLESTVEELTRSNQQLQEFTYIAAHDLKTPLRSIGTLADWISTDYGDKLDEKGREQVKLLVEKTKRMDNLIDSILHYSKVGHTMQERQKVDLNKLLSEAISEIDPPKNTKITIESELPTVICEQARMMQVFENLLSNAVKYIDKPKGRIRVGCVVEDGFWKFSVADNGPGIEEKYFEKIFGIFQTLSRRDEVASTGIGLSIVKRIVNVYGGSVWVESEVGKGSTFFFTLPKQTEAKNTKRKSDTAREK